MKVGTRGWPVKVESECRMGTAVLLIQRNLRIRLTHCLPSSDFDHPIYESPGGYQNGT